MLIANELAEAHSVSASTNP